MKLFLWLLHEFPESHLRRWESLSRNFHSLAALQYILSLPVNQREVSLTASNKSKEISHLQTDAVSLMFGQPNNRIVPSFHSGWVLSFKGEDFMLEWFWMDQSWFLLGKVFWKSNWMNLDPWLKSISGCLEMIDNRWRIHHQFRFFG